MGSFANSRRRLGPRGGRRRSAVVMRRVLPTCGLASRGRNPSLPRRRNPCVHYRPDWLHFRCGRGAPRLLAVVPVPRPIPTHPWSRSMTIADRPSFASEVRTHTSFVNGRFEEPTGETIDVRDPATWESSAASRTRGKQASTGRSSRPRRPSRPGAGRRPASAAAIIEKLADRLAEHADEIARLDALDTGNPLVAMRADIAKGIHQMHEAAGLAFETKGETFPLPGLHYTAREPWGVVGPPDHVQPPRDVRRRADRDRARRRELRDHQAVRAGAAQPAPDRRAQRRDRPRRRDQRRRRRAGDGRRDRRHTDRSCGSRSPGSTADRAPDPGRGRGQRPREVDDVRARRQEPDRRLPRRRPRRDGGGHRPRA